MKLLSFLRKYISPTNRYKILIASINLGANDGLKYSEKICTDTVKDTNYRGIIAHYLTKRNVPSSQWVEFFPCKHNIEISSRGRSPSRIDSRAMFLQYGIWRCCLKRWIELFDKSRNSGRPLASTGLPGGTGQFGGLVGTDIAELESH